MQHIKKGSLPALRIACVFMPLILALLSIASTSLSAELQNRIVFGVPFILWLWLSASVIICLATVLVGLSLKFDDVPTSETDSTNDSSKLNQQTNLNARGDRL